MVYGQSQEKSLCMKKGCLLLFLLGWMTTVSAQFLHEGDTIAIISPSSAMNKDALYGGIRTLESWGYRCVVGKNALNDYHGFAGTIDERLHDLLWALRAPPSRPSCVPVVAMEPLIC